MYMRKDFSEAIMKRSEKQSMHIETKAIETEVGSQKKEIFALANTRPEEENLKLILNYIYEIENKNT